MATTKAVTVHVPNNLNLEQAQRVLASVLNKAGHPACYSGLNISFVNAVDPAPLNLKVEPGSLAVGELSR